jgi:hypothetical protein
MSGEGKTSKFLLANATIMVGPRANVFELTPEDHSLGLTKQVNLNTENQWTELTQGITKAVIYTVNTGVMSTLTGEIYEYTARNLAYAAGVDATGAAYDEFLTTFLLSAVVDDADTTAVLATGGGASFAIGDFMLLQHDESDLVAVLKVGSISTDTITFAAGYAPPAGVVFATATTRVFRVRKPIKVGSQSDDGLFGVKIAGIMPENQRPIVAIFPKARIQKGLSLAFQEENFSNMPFEIKPYALLPTDAFYSDFTGNKTAMILPG